MNRAIRPLKNSLMNECDYQPDVTERDENTADVIRGVPIRNIHRNAHWCACRFQALNGMIGMPSPERTDIMRR